DARAVAPGCVSRRRSDPAPRRLPGWKTIDRKGAARARRTLATLARLRGVASLARQRAAAERKGNHMKIFVDTLASPIGVLTLAADETGLRQVRFEQEPHPVRALGDFLPAPERFVEVRAQLRAYF